MRSLLASLSIVAAGSTVAAAGVTVSPAAIHPGEPALITVTGVTEAPHGKGGGQPLVFYRTQQGYQAVFVAPLQIKGDHIAIEIAGTKPLSLAVENKKFPETSLVVEEEYANPPPEDREQINADNAAIATSYAKANGAPQFARAFRRPTGAVTSVFGEWRTFNDGHRAQHLGSDFAAREGDKVGAINDGTVVLVRDTFLAGNVVVVAHGGGISSLYFHLSKASVQEGETVTQGQEIGRAGHTGRTTGPHLHLSVHVANGMADPAAFLRLRLTPVRDMTRG